MYLYSFGHPHARLVLRHVSYGTVSPYQNIPAGDYTVSMRPAGAAATAQPVLLTGFWVSAGDAYTVAGMGPASGLRLQVLKDTLAVPAGRALVRVIQASLRQHLVRVALGGNVLARKLPFARTTSYQPVTAGTQVVRVAGSSEDASLGVSLPSDTIHTLVVLDGARGLRITSLEDAAGQPDPAQRRRGNRAGWHRAPARLTASLAGRDGRGNRPGRCRCPVVPADPARGHPRTLTRPRHAASRSRGTTAFTALAAGLAMITIGTAGRGAFPRWRDGRQAGRARVPAPDGPAARVPWPAATGRAALPVELTIPAIGVRTGLIRLGLTPAGSLQVPASTTVAGWYDGSPRPGMTGSSIIAGHIDSVAGPAVFFRLASLRPGDRAYVRRADGTLAVFRVTAVRTYRKDRFPTAAVYGPAAGPQLRLITCGGIFDPALRSYLSNTVVYAAAAGW